MAYFTWTSEQISVGVEEFDAEHQDLVNLLNLLCDAIIDGEVMGTHTLFDEFQRHAERHFAHEELLMQRLRFPGYEAHRQEHVKLLGELRTTGQTVGRVKDQDLDLFLVYYLGNWLLGHILTTDKEYAEFFREIRVAA